jgi:hypothetical protein
MKSDYRLVDDAFLWVTDDISPVESAALETTNLGSLKRKITYFLRRSDLTLQFQRVEGWTTGRIVGFMHGRGIPIERIRKDLAAIEQYVETPS